MQHLTTTRGVWVDHLSILLPTLVQGLLVPGQEIIALDEAIVAR